MESKSISHQTVHVLISGYVVPFSLAWASFPQMRGSLLRVWAFLGPSPLGCGNKRDFLALRTIEIRGPPTICMVVNMLGFRLANSFVNGQNQDSLSCKFD